MKKLNNYLIYGGIVTLGTIIGIKLYENKNSVKTAIIERDCTEIKPVRHYTKLKTVYKK